MISIENQKNDGLYVGDNRSLVQISMQIYILLNSLVSTK